MIGYLQGVLAVRKPSLVVIDVNGVGYELEVPMSTIYGLPDMGHNTKLLTHLVVRDDAMVLYGFATDSERQLFRQLLKVNGIGAKIALAVLSAMSSDEFSHMIHAGDVKALTRIPGIGKKTAERMVLELRDRLEVTENPPTASLSGTDKTASSGGRGEAQQALEQLGYRPAEAARLVSHVATEQDDTETIIRKALQVALGS